MKLCASCLILLLKKKLTIQLIEIFNNICVFISLSLQISIFCRVSFNAEFSRYCRLI